MQAPLLFVRGGLVSPDGMRHTGTDGHYWSSVGGNSSDAYRLYFRSGYVNPSATFTRYHGFSVRCVALGG